MSEFTIDTSQGRWETDGVPYNIVVAAAVIRAAEPGDVVIALPAEVTTLRLGKVLSRWHLIPVALSASEGFDSVWGQLGDRIQASARDFTAYFNSHPAEEEDGVWICGENPADGSQWTFVGVFTEKQLAIDACRDETYFIAPIGLNAVAPLEETEFPGAYYPLLTRDA